MRIARQNLYVRFGLAAWLLLCFVAVPGTPSSLYTLFGASPQAKKPVASKSAVKQPHERVEDIAQTLEYDQLHHRKGPSKNYTISESEINSYIGYKMKQQPPKGMKTLVVNLHEANRLTATALVDFDQVKLGNNEGLMATLFKKMLSGDHYLTMNGTLSSGQHRGQFIINRAELGGVTIPNTLVQAIIKHVGEKQNPPVDLTKSFELPYGIESVAISAGTVQVKT